MKTNRSALVIVLSALFVSMACSISQAQPTNPVVQTSSVPPEATPYLQVTPDASSGRVGTQYWKGTFPDSFYLLGSQKVPDIEISGISWMVLTYDKISGDVTSVEFGMSGLTWKLLPSPSIGVDYPEGFDWPPNDDAVTLPKELGLTGPIWRLASSDTINMGVQQFSFLLSNCERWTFNYTSDQMTGGIGNLGPAMSCFGRQSETNAFHLYKISNSR